MTGSAAAGGWGRRVLSAALLLPLFVTALVWGPPWVFGALVLGVGALGQWEFTRMFRRAGVEAFPVLGLVGGVLVSGSFFARDALPLALTAAILMVMAGALWLGRAVAWEPAGATVLGICYVNVLIGHAIWLRALPEGVEWILFLVGVTWAGETAAYAVGSAMGRHPLVPRISPRKTVEGAAAQLGAATLAAVVVHRLLLPERPAVEAPILGLLLGVVGQVGDLVESLLKRSVRAKDSGVVIPGHGGVLDRIDGLLFCAPVLFYCLTHGRGWGA